MKTFMASPATIERKWYVIDATGLTLGRLCSEVAKILRGKNKQIFTPHIDCGDYVIITNASKIKVTGKKLDDKIYYRHSDYVGGFKSTTLREMEATKPEEVIRLAVKGMLPKGPIGRQMIKKLHIYAGPEHKQAAQKPEVLELKFYSVRIGRRIRKWLISIMEQAEEKNLLPEYILYRVPAKSPSIREISMSTSVSRP